MSFSQFFISKRKQQIKQLSQYLVGKSITAIVDATETHLSIINIIDRDTFHHYSSELLCECKIDNSNTLVKVELWFFAHAGKYKLFQPHVDGSFDIMTDDQVKEIFTVS